MMQQIKYDLLHINEIREKHYMMKKSIVIVQGKSNLDLL